MGKKVLIAIYYDDFDPAGDRKALEILEENGIEVVYHPGRGGMTYEQVLEVIPEYDGLINYGARFDRKMAEAASKLKILAVYGVGYNLVDCDAAKEKGIKVTISRVPEHSNGVAEVAHALMLSMIYRIPQRHNDTVAGNFNQDIGTQLAGKTVGLMGFGAIAQAFAKQLQSSGVTLIAYDIFENHKIAAELNTTYVSFDELLKRSDIVSIHIPATPENELLFNDEVFSKMKDGAYLVNTSRGINVDEAALYRALKSGKLAGAAADAIQQEYPNKDNPLFTLDNFIVTPHIGGHNKEARRALSVSCAKSVVDTFAGREPYLWVNR